VTKIKSKGSFNFSRCRSFASQLQEIFKQENYHLIIGFNKMPGLNLYYAADVCFKARIAKNNFKWLNAFLPRYRYYLKAEQDVFEKSSQTQILLLSPNQKSEFSQYYQTPTARLHLLPPGIDKSRKLRTKDPAARSYVRVKLGVKATENLLLMVGSGFKTKGVDRSIKALAALPKILRSHTKLFIVGRDNPKKFLKLAKKLNLESQVKFLGGQENIPDFLLAADLLLHPAYHENTGTVILEAIISGLPVLASAVCGYANYVEEAQVGEIIPEPFSQIMLNMLLEKMLRSDKKLYWQRNGIAFSEHADIYSLPEKVVSFIENIGPLRAIS
jgi:UDP-glucose:(heptosyl)LPS alpha-1,3-glucosyltransferase